MFTSNGKYYCSSKRGEPGLISGLRGLAPEIHHHRYHHHPNLVAGKKKQHREFCEDDERKLHFRHGRRYTSFDDESSVSSYLPELKTPPDYLRTTTTPEFKTPPEFTPPHGNQSHGNQSHGNQSHGNQSHGNQLLNLRAALNEKELQLVELREQHITILNRAADARQNWEEALKSKDNVILQLQRTLQHKKVQLDRQERENQENLHALRKRQKEDAAVEEKELTIALLEAKNAQFVQEVVEQQKLITRMKRHIDEKEKLGAGQHQKLEMMNGRVQDLKAALQGKEEEADMQSKYCNELKTLLWKRDSMIAQLQLSEQQLQSNLAREVAAREAILMCRDKLQEEKTLLEKRLSELQSHHKATGKSHQKGNNESEIRKLIELKDDFSNVQEGALKDLDDREGVMHRIQKRMRELQRSLRSKDNALSDKNNELQQALQEIQRVTEEYEALKQEVEEVNKRNEELETALAQLQDYADARTAEASVSEAPVEVLPYEFSLGGSTGEDHGGDDALLECVESLEQLSNASVYRANFEKVEIVEVEILDTDPKQRQQEQQVQQQKQQKQKQQQKQQEQQQQKQKQEQQQQKQKQEQQQEQEQEQQKQQQKKNASVAVAHFPSKLKPPKNFNPPPPAAATSPVARPSSPPSDLLQYQELDANYNSIQDEIKKREQCWRKTEELMRAALTRRVKLLEEAKEAHSSETNVTWSAKSGLKLHEKSGYLRNYQEEASGRGSQMESKKVEMSNAASADNFEQDSGKTRTNQMEYSKYYERKNGRSGRVQKGRFL